MDFKNLASKIIDDVSGIKSTETSKNEDIKDILEGLDLNFDETVSKDLSEDFDLDIEDEIPEENSREVEQLFDGYLGEKNFDPNPLEYGPNAMYRRNGTVYRKTVDNLWESYLKDGSPGPRGSAGGSGTGTQEVQRIVSDNIQQTYVTDSSKNLSVFNTSIISNSKVPQKRLDRPIRIATFGPSTTNCYQDISATDVENLYTAFPTSGTKILTSNINYCAIASMTNSLIVANGGVDGDGTSAYLARAKASFTAGRKAPQDIIKKAPDVVICYGGCSNDLAYNITSSSTDSEILEYADAWIDIVETFTNQGIPVIDEGCHGYNTSAAKQSYVRRAILLCNTYFTEKSKTNPLWLFQTNPVTTLSDGGTDPLSTYDGTHQNWYGGAYVAKNQLERINMLFGTEYAPNNLIFSDDISTFAASTGQDPTNYFINVGSTTVGTRTCTINKWNIPVTVTSASTISYSIFVGTKFTSLTSGDNIVIDGAIEILDTNGNRIDYPCYLSTKMKLVSSATSAVLEYDTSENFILDGYKQSSFRFAMPVAGNQILGGASSFYYVTVSKLQPGSYTIVIKPNKYRKITPLNTLP